MTKKAHYPIRSVFVLGATSAVAVEICKQLVIRGCSRFHMVARDLKAVERISQELQKISPIHVSMQQADLCNSFNDSLLASSDIVDFDLYLIAVGYLGDSNLASVDAREALKIYYSNVLGLIPWITAIASPRRLSLPLRLWAFSSVAADSARPSNYVYGSAKAALTEYLEGIRLRCHDTPFMVRIIKAGYIDTPMSSSVGPKILKTSPKNLVKSLLRKPNKVGIEYLPFWWHPIMIAVRLLPAVVLKRL